VLCKKNSLRPQVCLLLLSCLITGRASADTFADHTHVSMTGRILDTPCSIDPGSREQTIRMGTTSVTEIARHGAGRLVPFTVKLRDCSPVRSGGLLPDWQGLSVTFDGASDGGDFTVSGAANGVALRIFDENGNRAIPGKPLPDEPLGQDDPALNFTMQLVGNHRMLVRGDYRAVIHFGISYF